MSDLLRDPAPGTAEPVAAPDVTGAVLADPGRLAAVRATGLLDTDAEEAFDRLTRLAVRLVGVPAAFVSLVDADRDFYKSACGFGEPLASVRELTGPTFCHHTVQRTTPLIIPDTAADPAYRDVPTVRTLGVAAYVGVPLVAGGHAIGAFCAIDTRPRAWTDADIEVLTELATSAQRELDLRGQRAALEASNRQLQQQAAELEAQAEALQESNANLETALGDAVRARRAADVARRDADAANQAKSSFLATMSHEFRTPVNAMLGYTQLLELGLAGPLTDAQRRYVERLTTSSHHLLGLVNDVLDLSRIEAGEARLTQVDGDTGPPVGAALDLVRPQASAKGVRLVDERPDELGVPFVGDEDRVRQVVLNLLANAVKFTGGGGAVSVTCDTVATTPAASQLTGDGPWACVRVADTGVGIPAEEQGRIFDAFHQVEGGHTRTAGGTGLGLAISRRLARLMGGDLTVESVPGAGSTFTLWLPATRLAHGARAETAAERRGRSDRQLPLQQAPGLGVVGAALRDSVNDVLASYADRLQADPAIPPARVLRRLQLEDHQGSFLAALAQSLVIADEAGPAAADELRDGSVIQRAIAEAHGARRHAQGFDEAALRRDHQIFREEVERAVRGQLRADGEPAAAVQVLGRLMDRAEAVSVAGWRRAAAT